MAGPKAPKDPERKRPYFYIMKDKDIYGSVQEDGSGKRKRTTVSGIYDNRYGRWCHTFDWRGDLLER